MIGNLLTPKDIALKHGVTTRHVRRIINNINDEYPDLIIVKNNRWFVSDTLLPLFKPQRIRVNKYYALNIDPCSKYSKQDIDKIMNFIVEQMGEICVEINYVVESKIANGRNHLHCFIKCENKKKLLQCIRLGFSNMSYNESKIFDITGWKKYIQKQGEVIKQIKN